MDEISFAVVCFHIHSMPRKTTNLEDNDISIMMVNGCDDRGVSISMGNRQRSPILDELSA